MRNQLNLAFFIIFMMSCLPAMGQGVPIASSRPQVEALENSIEDLKAQINELTSVIRELKGEVQELRAGASVPSDGASPPVPARIEEEQQLLNAKVEEQYQTKVESASRYRVRLSGIVLLNLFNNRGGVDNPEFPSLARSRDPLELAGITDADQRSVRAHGSPHRYRSRTWSRDRLGRPEFDYLPIDGHGRPARPGHARPAHFS